MHQDAQSTNSNVVGGSNLWRYRSSAMSVLLRLCIFSCLTALILARKVVPYRALPALGSLADRVLYGFLEILWWYSAALAAVSFMRAFLVSGQRPRESKLMQDILAALIYAGVCFAVIANVFGLPVKGLLATSGALAIVLGLALQSSLSDVFSGIVLDLERPYHVGDWIVVDDNVRGAVIETNWRSTHILTPTNDVAVLPNSLIAKARLINCSAPTRVHGASLRLRLDASRAPTAGYNLLREVLLGCTTIERIPEPSVTILQVDADSIEYELAFNVAHVGVQGKAQNELLERVFVATSAVGIQLSPRVGTIASSAHREGESLVPNRLIANISLFATLTENERATLASQMRRRVYRSGDVVVPQGAVLGALSIVKDGALVASETLNGSKVERLRLTPGSFFGETGVLTGKPAAVELTALTDVTTYELAKDALTPLLKARPELAEELSTVLASRQFLRQCALDLTEPGEADAKGLVGRLAESIHKLFGLS